MHMSLVLAEATRVPDAPELELQMRVSHLVWVLGVEHWSSVRAVLLTVEPLLLPYI